MLARNPDFFVESTCSAQQTLLDSKDDLEALIDFINIKLNISSVPIPKDSPFARGDQFSWRHEVQQDQPPYDIEELAIEHHQSGNWDEAKKLFSLLVRLFPSYAEGYNYLGLLALNEDQPKEAAEFFRQAIKEGRKLFPRRTSKKDYWMDLDTRPFMRGYMNLPIALNRAGKWKEALKFAIGWSKSAANARRVRPSHIGQRRI